MVLLVACNMQLTDAPSISDIKVEPTYVRQGEKFSIGYVVHNPLPVNFVGAIDFKSDCFQNTPIKKEISISAGDKVPFKGDFFAYNQNSGNVKEKCQGIQEVTVVLEDGDGKKLASYGVQLNIVS